MQFHNHVDTQPEKCFDRSMRCLYDIKFGMLQVRKNDISLRKFSGSSAHLRTLEATLVTNSAGLTNVAIVAAPRSSVKVDP